MMTKLKIPTVFATLFLSAPAEEPAPPVFTVVPPAEGAKNRPVEITIRNADPALSQAIMTAVHQAIAGKGEALENKPSTRTPEAVDEKIRAQSERVEKLRQELAALVSEYEVPDFSDNQETHLTPARLAQFKAQQAEMEEQLEKLESLENESLVNYAAGLDLPENPVLFFHAKYRKAIDRKSDLMVGGLGANHPDVVSEDREIATHLSKALNEVTSLRADLKTRLMLIKQQVDRTENRLKKLQGKPDESPALKAFKFKEATRDYEEARSLLQALKRQKLGLDR